MNHILYLWCTQSEQAQLDAMRDERWALGFDAETQDEEIIITRGMLGKWGVVNLSLSESLLLQAEKHYIERLTFELPNVIYRIVDGKLIPTSKEDFIESIKLKF